MKCDWDGEINNFKKLFKTEGMDTLHPNEDIQTLEVLLLFFGGDRVGVVVSFFFSPGILASVFCPFQYFLLSQYYSKYILKKFSSVEKMDVYFYPEMQTEIPT